MVLPDQASPSDRSASSRLEALDKSLNELKREQAELTKQWERERDDMRRLQSIKVGRSARCSQRCMMFTPSSSDTPAYGSAVHCPVE